MTFASPEARHAFHALPTGLQVLLYDCWRRVTAGGKFLEVTQASDSEVILRITVQPKAHSAADSALHDDET